jgi:phenylpyruvate tautomerase PptA (4-oxalocrotonate tautomerase family)
MPTYRCTVPQGLLDTERKAALAREITRIHNAVTGAATFFAQVVFDEVPTGNYFIGGAALSGEQIFVNGQIRAGRSDPDLKRLLAELVEGVAKATMLPRRAVWVYVTELPARRMAEYGHVLPEPGDEPTWLAGLPENDRSHMLAVGA